jgi:hypothetical protein
MIKHFFKYYVLYKTKMISGNQDNGKIPRVQHRGSP